MPQDRFLEILRAYQASAKAEEMSTEVNRRLQREKTRKHILGQELEQELVDVESLEQMGIRQLFKRFLGDQDQQLEKERQEYLLKALEYNECLEAIKLLSYEKDILQKKIDRKEQYLSTLQELIARNNNLVENWPSSLAKSFLEKQNERRKIYELQIDIEEIIVVVKSLAKTMDQLLDNAEKSKKIESWGANYAQIQKNKALSQSHIDRAYHLSHHVQKLMDDLDKEIQDIKPYVDLLPSSQIKEFALFTHTLYRRLIDDWIIEQRLDHSERYLEETSAHLIELATTCDEQLQILHTRISVIESYIEIILNDVNLQND